MPEPVSQCRSCGASIRESTFWSHVRKQDGCWLWEGGCDKHGYGRQCHTLTNRLAWIFTFGDPGDLFVLHKCDNPPCCNPAHLFLGTQADNMADMNSKGRRRNRALLGEANPQAVMTEELVKKIRGLYGPPRGQGVKMKPTQKDIAALLGIKRSLVCEAILGRWWRHVQ